MKWVVRIPLDEGTLNYLQMLSYEADGLRVLNCQLIRSGGGDGERYKVFLKQYQEATAAYQMAFAEAVKAAAPGYWEQKYQHEISFLTGELNISRKDGEM